jgi:hypothetical protein
VLILCCAHPLLGQTQARVKVEPLSIIGQTKPEEISEMVLSRNSRWLAVLTKEGELYVTDLTTSKSTTFHTQPPIGYVRADLADRYIIGYAERTLFVVRLDEQPTIQHIVLKESIDGITCSRSGRALIAMCRRNWYAISLPDMAVTHEVDRPIQHTWIVPDDEGESVYIATYDDHIDTYNLATRASRVVCQFEPIQPRNANFMTSGFLCFGVDKLRVTDRILAVGRLAKDGKFSAFPCLKVWDLKRGAESYSWVGKEDRAKWPHFWFPKSAGHYFLTEESPTDLSLHNILGRDSCPLNLPRDTSVEDLLCGFSADGQFVICYSKRSETLYVCECESSRCCLESRLGIAGVVSIAGGARQEVFLATKAGRVYRADVLPVAQRADGSPVVNHDHASLRSLLSDASKARECYELLQSPGAVDLLLKFLDSELLREPTRDLLGEQLRLLDSNSYRTRRRAAAALLEYGPSLLPALRKAAAGTTSLNLKQEIDGIASAIVTPSPERRMFYGRSVALLSRINNTESRKLLYRLAQCDPNSYLAMVAKETLGEH